LAFNHHASIKPLDDGGKNFVIIQPRGYCNQCYHCDDIVENNYRHTFHPFCLGAMLEKTNKCCVCEQKLHPDWWSSWGIREVDDEMTKLVKDMQLDDLQMDMVASVHGSYKMWTCFKVKRFV
jgi:hypothetical protein